MELFFLIVANILMIASAYFLVQRISLRRMEQISIMFVLWIVQVIAVMLFCGVLLQTFHPIIVALISGVFSGTIIGLTILAYGHKRIADAKSRKLRLSRFWWKYIGVGCLISLFVVVILFQLYSTYLLPPHDWDSMLYHLVSIADWIQQGKIAMADYAIWTNVYPHHAELVYAWLMVFIGHDRFVDGGQLLFGIGGLFAVIGLARSSGLNRTSSLFAGLIFFLTPIVVAQLRTTYVDLAFASMFLMSFFFLIRTIQSQRYIFLIFTALSGGVALGIKSSAVAYVGIIFVVLLFAMFLHKPLRSIQLKEKAKYLLGFILIVAGLGSFWYIRTWIYYGNPIYPFQVSLFGHMLFNGEGTVQSMIMDSNTPAEIKPLSIWKQIWYSWSSEPTPTHYDQRLGGFGLQWVWLLFPALLIFSIYTVWKKRMLFWLLVVPFAVLFIVQPSAWWSRYTIFIVALAAIAFVYIVDKIRPPSIQLAFHILMVGMICYSLQLHTETLQLEKYAEARALPKEERTFGKLYYPEYGWIDQLPAGATIAVRQSPFLYPFFGHHLQHRLIAIKDEIETKEMFLLKIVENQVDYVFTRMDADVDGWVKESNETFIQLGEQNGFRWYEVIK